MGWNDHLEDPEPAFEPEDEPKIQAPAFEEAEKITGAAELIAGLAESEFDLAVGGEAIVSSYFELLEKKEKEYWDKRMREKLVKIPSGTEFGDIVPETILRGEAVIL